MLLEHCVTQAFGKSNGELNMRYLRPMIQALYGDVKIEKISEFQWKAKFLAINSGTYEFLRVLPGKC